MKNINSVAYHGTMSVSAFLSILLASVGILTAVAIEVEGVNGDILPLVSKILFAVAALFFLLFVPLYLLDRSSLIQTPENPLASSYHGYPEYVEKLRGGIRRQLVELDEDRPDNMLTVFLSVSLLIFYPIVIGTYSIAVVNELFGYIGILALGVVTLTGLELRALFQRRKIREGGEELEEVVEMVCDELGVNHIPDVILTGESDSHQPLTKRRASIGKIYLSEEVTNLPLKAKRGVIAHEVLHSEFSMSSPLLINAFRSLPFLAAAVLSYVGQPLINIVIWTAFLFVASRVFRVIHTWILERRIDSVVAEKVGPAEAALAIVVDSSQSALKPRYGNTGRLLRLSSVPFASLRVKRILKESGLREE